MTTTTALAVQWVKFGELEIKFQAEVDASTPGGKAVLELQDLVLAKGIDYVQKGCPSYKEGFTPQTRQSRAQCDGYAISLQAGANYWLGSYPASSSGHPKYKKFYYYDSDQPSETRWQLLNGGAVNTYLICNDRNYHWSYNRSCKKITLEEDYANQYQNASNWFEIDTDNGLVTPYNASDESKTYGPDQQDQPTPFNSLSVSDSVGGPGNEIKVSSQ